MSIKKAKEVPSSQLPNSSFSGFLDGLAQPYPCHQREVVRSHLAFLTLAYLGMSRHAYLSSDWIAHNHMWADVSNQLSETLAAPGVGGAERPLTKPLTAELNRLGFVARSH